MHQGKKEEEEEEGIDQNSIVCTREKKNHRQPFQKAAFNFDQSYETSKIQNLENNKIHQK